MSQVGVGGLDEPIGVVKHVNRVSVIVDGVTDFNKFSHVKRFAAVCAVAVVVVATTIVFVVVVPLSDNNSRIIASVFDPLKIHET